MNVLPTCQCQSKAPSIRQQASPVFTVHNVVFHNLSGVFDAETCARGLVRFCVFTDRPAVPNLCDTDPGW